MAAVTSAGVTGWPVRPSQLRVVNKASREPSGQFSDLARSVPFSRPASWTWQDEQQRVFAQHREE